MNQSEEKNTETT